MSNTYLTIADTIINLHSDFLLQQLSEEEKRLQYAERCNNVFYNGKAKPDILIKVEVVDKLPEVSGETIFITNHFQSKTENWRMVKKGDSYIYKSPLEDKKQLMLVNRTFDRVTAYFLPKTKNYSGGKESQIFIKKHKGFVWSASDIIYDFLQVLLINYFAQRNEGIFTHSVGIKDIDGEGLLFNGKSGCGKSTTARLWHKHSKAIVLNDDRIIVRKINGKFFIYGSPWHGEFSDYLESRIERAPL